jgi:ubiquinone/menaquinone biosynthesis C-methylase UbiE
MDKYLQENKSHWNELTTLHEKSGGMYDVAGFKAGKCTLKAIELVEMGDVKGKSLLHLQCHFGMDTLSWVRRGAKATGIDFSDKAIDLARKLSKETGIKADFLCTDIYDLPSVLDKQYDIVFTSWGVLTWLPDLDKWAQIISHFLKPGGFFYIVEFHPFTLVFDDTPTITKPEVSYPYFQLDEPLKFENQPDYASGITVKTAEYGWQYPLGKVVTALVNAGLRIEFLHEFPVTCYKALPYLKKDDDGWWHLEGDRLPLTFSIKASK